MCEINKEDIKAHFKNLYTPKEKISKERLFAFIGLSIWEFKQILETGVIKLEVRENNFYIKKNVIQVMPLKQEEPCHENNDLFFEPKVAQDKAIARAQHLSKIFDNLEILNIKPTKDNVIKYLEFAQLFNIAMWSDRFDDTIDLNELSYEEQWELIDKIDKTEFTPDAIKEQLLRFSVAIEKSKISTFFELISYFEQKSHRNIDFLFQQFVSFKDDKGVILALNKDVAEKGTLKEETSKLIVHKKNLKNVPVNANMTGEILIDGPEKKFEFFVNKPITYKDIAAIAFNSRENFEYFKNQT